MMILGLNKNVIYDRKIVFLLEGREREREREKAESLGVCSHFHEPPNSCTFSIFARSWIDSQVSALF